ncbi:hypothetical protein RND81_03G226500 [Saponaria officinalis]|uniref:BHLH domain-containing protein n=1 Tax=Saponaria officinalis TaxID=3572 RepID=A0AAW1M9M2_SAPOF
MEKIHQCPINPCVDGEDWEVGWLEELVSNCGSNYTFEDLYYYNNNNTESLLPNLEDKMPFMQMLQGVETAVTPAAAAAAATSSSFPLMQEPNYFQLLLKLQHEKIKTNVSSNFASLSELEKTVKSETCTQFTKTTSCNVEAEVGVAPKERRKRKRASKVGKNKEEVESQRMTHIAVERNRRKLMNDHLNALRSLMPASYVQRGDQASIIGGAIDFVKEMEQLLQSLEAQKKMKYSENNNVVVSASSSTASSSNLIQFTNIEDNEDGNNGNFRRNNNKNNNEEYSAENMSAVGDIKVVVIQNHVNLKIECQRRPGQLIRAILGFEELRLTILHLNITSFHTLVHYSFNLKIEEDCKLGSADEVVKAVHHIFSLINLT